ncbi:MAG: inositol monophosphatase [Bacteroidales bacterium]|nr:inositol monophosphatase [Bacteroidales bacterium]
MKQTLLLALKTAGAELLKHYGQPVDFKVKESQSSIVTKADLKSDSLITTLVREHFPSHNIISEESGYRNVRSKYTWVIDPLDGTSNFASGLPWFGVLIAVFENSTPIMGGAYLPVNDLIYFAEKDKGASKNGQSFTMEKNKGLRNSLISFSVDYTDNEIVLNESLNIYKNLVKATRNIRSTNSLVDFLYVAEGKFGGCINLFTKVWDISALGLIISEAGGVMKNIKGEDIQFLFDENIVEKNFAVMSGSEEIVGELKKVLL